MSGDGAQSTGATFQRTSNVRLLRMNPIHYELKC